MVTSFKFLEYDLVKFCQISNRCLSLAPLGRSQEKWQGCGYRVTESTSVFLIKKLSQSPE